MLVSIMVRVVSRPIDRYNVQHNRPEVQSDPEHDLRHRLRLASQLEKIQLGFWFIRERLRTRDLCHTSI